RRRHTRSKRDWSSDVCSSDLVQCVTVGVQERRGPYPSVHILRTHPLGEMLVDPHGPLLALTVRGPCPPRFGDRISRRHKAPSSLPYGTASGSQYACEAAGTPGTHAGPEGKAGRWCEVVPASPPGHRGQHHVEIGRA